MTTEEMKAIYEANPDEWIIVHQYLTGAWCILKKCGWYKKSSYKLIHVKHKHILDAYLADNTVEIWMDNVIPTAERWGGSYRVDNFIENYNPDLEYRLKNRFRPKSIIYDDYEEKEDGSNNIENSSDDYIVKSSVSAEQSLSNFQKEKEDDREYSNGFSDGNPSDSSIGDNIQELNNFQDYNFTADFEGEIFKEIDEEYFGYVFDMSILRNIAMKWSSLGVVLTTGMNRFKLTPIKKEWYEYDFKRKLVIVDEEELMFATSYNDGCYTIRPLKNTSDYDYAMKDRVRPATKEEVMSLYVSKED